MHDQNLRTKSSPLIVYFCEEEVTNILDATSDAQNENRHVVTHVFHAYTALVSGFFFLEFFDTCTPCCFAFQALPGFGNGKGDWLQRLSEGGELTGAITFFP